MTPTQKKYTTALGNLYKYQVNWYDFSPNPDRVLVMVMGLEKNYSRWYYKVVPLEDHRDVMPWMKGGFSVACSDFITRAFNPEGT